MKLVMQHGTSERTTGGAAIRSIRYSEVASVSCAKEQKTRFDKDTFGAVLEAPDARTGRAVSR